MKVNRKWYGMITACIFMLIALAYLLTNIPQVQDVISRSASMPIYRSNRDEVCLISIYEGDVAALKQIATKAASGGVALTIAVTPDTFVSSPEEAKGLQAMGHCLALSGYSQKTNETSEQWMQRSYEALLKFKSVTGATDVLYVPYLGQYTKEASRFCARYGLQYLLYCKDSRTYPATSTKSFAQALANRAEKGDFIYMALDGTTDFSSIAKYFSERKLTLSTVSKILFD